MAANDGLNTYASPNPTKCKVGTRHSASDVTHWSFILLDIDPMPNRTYEGEADPNYDPDPMNALGTALALLGAWWGYDFTEEGEHRPIIIDSGRGSQAWIRLDDIVLTDEPSEGGITRKQARKAMGYWLKRVADSMGVISYCAVDTSTSDLPRLMRCPGTSNKKTGRVARIVHPGYGPLKGLAERIVAMTPEGVFMEPDVSDVKPGRKWQFVMAELTRMAQDYLLNGQAEPGRHKVVWHTAKKLAEVGVYREEARKALLRANKLQGKEEEMDPQEIEHALGTAYDPA